MEETFICKLSGFPVLSTHSIKIIAFSDSFLNFVSASAEQDWGKEGTRGEKGRGEKRAREEITYKKWLLS